jgi:hypothetical protein
MRATEELTPKTGWIVFAATMMIIGGTLNAFYGVVALVNDNWVVWQNRTAVLLDLTTWGWILVGFGLVVALAGFGLLTGNMAARVVAVLCAGASMVVNFMFMPVFPLWTLTVIVVDALVIWAVVAHGGEAESARRV